MSDCKYRRKDGVCLKDLEYVYKGYCVDAPCSCYAPQTNADCLTSKTTEELAELFSHLCCPYSLGGNVKCNAESKGCYECWLDWLKSPVEEVDNGN